MAHRHGFLVAIMIGLGLTGALASEVYRAPEPNGSEVQLFKKLDFAISNNPPRAEDVVKAFSLKRKCARQTCFFDGGDVGGLTYGSGNIRPSETGLIFVLEDFAGECIRVDRAENHYGTAGPSEECDHGGCWYRTAQSEWGIIGFGVSGPEAQCASSVVINTQPYQRPKRRQ